MNHLSTVAAVTLCGTCISIAGEIADAGWARARLNDGSDLTRTKFVYAESSKAVRLYLIDSGIDNSGGWFDGNQNLTLNPSVFVGPSHLEQSGNVSHGTKMLGIIAGPETGTALGLPLEVISYDVAGAEEGTFISYISAAVFEAIDHYQQNPGIPSVICMAVGSSDPMTDSIFEAAVNKAVENGMTVVVSAGNHSGSASDYVPAAYGIKPGVICVGGSTSTNSRLPMSNQGAAVDLYAPAENVPTIDTGGVPNLLTGTSAAAAITAGAALTELSKNPSLTPAELESLLKETAFAASSLAVLQLKALPDSDGDGFADYMEAFFGTDPTDPSDRPEAPRPVCTDGALCLRFTISEALFDPANPYQLSDGTTWRALISSSFEGWAVASGKITTGTPKDGKIPVNFTVSTGLPRTYLKLEITPHDPTTPLEPVVSLAEALHGAEWEDVVTKEDGSQFQALLVMNAEGEVTLELVPLEEF